MYLVLSAVLSRGGSPMERAAVIVVYNLIAFAFQLPLGILADRLDKNRLLAAAGCLLAATAYPVRCLPRLACCMAALGNALFHLGGGTEVLNLSGGKAALPGIFVSSGAAGLWLAYRFAGRMGYILLPALMLCTSLLSVLLCRYDAVHNAPLSLRRPAPSAVTAAACFLLTVALRSYMGMILDYPWKTGAASLLFVLAVVLGKALGGVLADRLGRGRLIVVSLTASAVLFTFSFRSPAAGIAAVLLFNMTMPVTLTALAALSGGKHGMAFGMTTFALFLGFVPVLAGKTALFHPLWLAAGALVSAALMSGGLWAYRRREGGK